VSDARRLRDRKNALIARQKIQDDLAYALPAAARDCAQYATSSGGRRRKTTAAEGRVGHYGNVMRLAKRQNTSLNSTLAQMVVDLITDQRRTA